MSRKEQLDAVRKGVQNINRAKEEPVDANAVIIGNFLQGYIAVDEYGPGVTVMTTDEIISALSNRPPSTKSSPPSATSPGVMRPAPSAG